MSDDLSVMDGQGTEVAEPQGAPETSAAPEPTLDDIYRSANIESSPTAATPAAQQPTAQQQAQPQIPNVPDPFDTEAFKNYQGNLARNQQVLGQALAQVVQSLTQQQQKEAVARLEQDVQSAVTKVSELIGVSDKPKLIEAFIDMEARSDSKVKALWENRHKNPEAWEKTLGVLSKKIARELDLKVDPALAEAQRARKTAQRAMATTSNQEPDANQKWDNMSQEQFDRSWQATLSGGY